MCYDAAAALGDQFNDYSFAFVFGGFFCVSYRFCLRLLSVVGQINLALRAIFDFALIFNIFTLVMHHRKFMSSY